MEGNAVHTLLNLSNPVPNEVILVSGRGVLVLTNLFFAGVGF